MSVASSSPTAAVKPKVLYVDDQEGNTVVFRANFKKYFDVRTASSGPEALELLSKDEFPVILTDQRMDGMNGATFLAEARKLQPDSVRMLVTAYTDFDDVVAAINEGQVSRFIGKPWDRQDLLNTLLSAVELYSKNKENRALTEQLLHRERLAAIGQVTSGLVHELGNIAAVLSVAEGLAEDWKNGVDIARELEILQSGVEKFLVLMESLRLYSRGGGDLNVTRKAVDLVQVVRSTLTLLQLFPVVKTLQSLEFVPPPMPVQVQVDAKKLEQVLLNVIKNAAESCPPGKGRVVVDIRVDERNACIDIADNGPGIPPPAWQKVWDGFYSTKGEKGTGLGLAMCRKIMVAHGGQISFVNRAEGGCTFTLQLPR